MATRYNYTGQLITDGLVLNLDAAKRDSYPGSGTTWYDLSGNGNNGTLTNGPTYTGVSKDAAIVFDGADDYGVVTPSSPVTPYNQSRTVNTWFKPNVFPTLNYAEVIMTGNSTAPNTPMWEINLAPNKGLDLYQGGSHYNIGTNVLTTSSIVNVNYLFNSTNNRVDFYLNGSPIYSNTIGESNYQKNNIYLATGYWGKTNVNIATAQIYNRSLSQFEIFQNFNAMKGRYGIPDIVTDGLVLNLDAGNPYSYLSGSSGTTWTDVSGEGSDGTLTNGASYANGAIEFDGVDDYVNLGNNFSFNSSFSLEVWIKNTNQGVDGLISKDDVSSNREWNFHITSASPNPYSLRFRINGVDTVDGTTVIGNDNTWHQCVAIYNGSQMLIYLDTVLDNSKTVSGTPTINTSAECQIGNFDGNVYPYNGNIAITRIYNKALTADEISQNFNALRGRYGI